MRRRFAGEKLAPSAATGPDALTTATDTLKTAQKTLKSSRGGRLGQGSQLEREEATTSKAAGSEAVLPTAGAVPTGATPPMTSNIASLRKALGIDDLLMNLRGAETEQAAEMPTFEMPEFDMPAFELPDFESLFADAFSKYAPKEPETTTDGAQPSVGSAVKPPSTKVTVGGKTYNLAKTGGSGLGSQDIKKLQEKGWSKGEIKQAATQATRVSAGAQKVLGNVGKAASTGGTSKAQDTAKTLTTKASQAVAAASSSGGPNGGGGGGGGGSSRSGGGGGGGGGSKGGGGSSGGGGGGGSSSGGGGGGGGGSKGGSSGGGGGGGGGGGSKGGGGGSKGGGGKK